MDYLHSFSNNIDFNNMYNGSAYTEPWVSVTNTGSSTPSYRVNYNNKIKKLIGTPLTFEVTSNGSIVLKYNHRPSIPITVEYSKNGGTWETIQFVNTGEDVPQQSAITVTNGNYKIRFDCNNNRKYVKYWCTADFMLIDLTECYTNNSLPVPSLNELQAKPYFYGSRDVSSW